jgi:hypothetical protein
MTDDPIPPPRHPAYDKLARRIEEMADRRLVEHHRLRQLHRTGLDGRCTECGQRRPCKSMQVVDGLEIIP